MPINHNGDRMFTTTLKKYSSDAGARVYFDLSVVHQDNPQLLNLELTTHIALVLEDGLSVKDISDWPAKNFTVFANKLFTEKELSGLQRDYYASYPLKDDSPTMAMLKEELYEFLNTLLQRIEIKVHLTPEIEISMDKHGQD
jgi:hypothetical protein